MKSKKKNSKKSAIEKYIKLGLFAIGFILVILGIFIEDVEIPFKLFGVVLMTVISVIYALSSEEHAIIKSVGVIMLSALLLTWLLPYGYFSSETFTDYGMKRVGLNDLPTTIYYALYFCMDKVIYLFELAGFYMLLSKTNGYQNLINVLAKKIKGHELVFSIVTIVVFVALTTLLTQTFAVLFFVPFAISIMAKLKMDKLTTFAVTFGSILVGTLGAVWGTDGVYWFNYYASTNVKDGIWYRVIIESVALILFIVLTVLRLKKNKNEDVVEDLCEIGKEEKKVSIVPTCIVLCLTVILLLLGYIGWTDNFNIEAFDNFHTWLTELTIGEDVTIFSYILGSAATAFGSWDIVTFVAVIFVMSIIISLINKININDYVKAYLEGFKKVFIPVLLYLSVFVVFVLSYTSPFMTTFSNWIYTSTDSMNPYLATLTAFITNVFHADLGYTGYIVGSFLTSAFADQIGILHTIYVSMYGLVQLFVPTSGILLLGLSITKLDYKDWFKYIWIFVVGMFVILLVLFTVITYI